MKEAVFYEVIGDSLVQCRLCPHRCRIADGKTGRCRVRKNVNGRLYSLNFGKITAINIDPIEKKPLYHFYPGSTILSVGTFGCNFRCGFCQNYEISQIAETGEKLLPEDLVKLAQRYKSQEMIGVAYTYSEPVVWYEYIEASAPLIKELGFKTVLVTNGFINKEPLKKILPFIDALNIDLKGITEEYYRDICQGSVTPVLEAIETSKAFGAHVEVTTLLVPGLNDAPEQIEELAKFLANLDRDIPLHFSRYFPRYKFNLPPTPVESLIRAREIARKYLNYVYLGNLPDASNDTFCPHCGALLIRRDYFGVDTPGLSGDTCRQCKNKVKIIL
ncbi:AmmeMemoRadiSam system radical SAM enzyme [Carboxydothermus hydrogenoformans]|uniref:Radical SAM domain protein n=1 Tax=Carboxydothermus hydrogenoformans (strain ATCC BAA-161 / DSM 6008 / Z-2901) TaxID=246194 RepID=Q3A9V8_CARHZ|nr:AmmeMemoRadiSam system radical SAM enzyme [Carboxydothermus hydrogenoformans]ABB15907.1 radical SAM domain protein [Carboxydothermus hydrogenoformans Z-2901]